MARWLLADCLADRGHFAEGLAHGQEGIRIAEALDHAYSLVLACWGRGYVHLLKGEFTEALGMYERALALCRQYNLAILESPTTAYLGVTYARSGRLAEGLPLLDQALKTQESMGMRNFLVANTAYLGEAHLLIGQTKDASEMATRALTQARERGERGGPPWKRPTSPSRQWPASRIFATTARWQRPGRSRPSRVRASRACPPS